MNNVREQQNRPNAYAQHTPAFNAPPTVEERERVPIRRE